jgi:glucuronoarabinoxylan endo-1,4-beta-xylanase
MGTTMASFVTLMASNGVPIYAVSIQNEPDINQNYPSCLWTAQQIHDVVPYVYSAFQTAGVGNTLLMIPEESSWDFSYASTAMNDPSVAEDVGILAAHAYSGTAVAPTNFGKSVWMSEVSSQSGTFDGSMTNALGWAAMIHSYLATANVNAWVWWAFSDQVWQGDGTDNGTLTDINGNPAKRAYVTGQWSKFVRPGWNRIDVTDASGMSITAFKNTTTGQFAIVVVNSGSANSDTFSLSGFNAASVTPWITDATRSLTQQSDVAVTGGTFSYTVPAGSVMTFAGQAQ